MPAAFFAVWNVLTHRLLLVARESGTARRTFGPIPELPYVYFQLRNCAAQRIAVHVQLAGGTALVALVLLQDGQDEPLLKLTHCLGIKNVALVHLHDEGFELIFHGGLSFFQLVMNTVFK